MVKKGKCYQISKRYYTKPVCEFHLNLNTDKTKKQTNKKQKNLWFKCIF